MRRRSPGDVHLQQQRKLGDDVLRRAALLLLAQPVVGLDDLAQLVGQVVLRPAGAKEREQGKPSAARKSKQGE